MKKFTCVILSALLAISMVACSSDKKEDKPQEPANSTVTEVTGGEEEQGTEEETPAVLTELPEWVDADKIEAEAFTYSRDDVSMYFFNGCDISKLSDENKDKILFITGCETIEEAQTVLDQCMAIIMAE